MSAKLGIFGLGVCWLMHLYSNSLCQPPIIAGIVLFFSNFAGSKANLLKPEEKYTRRRLRSSYLTTVISIVLVLFVLGLLGLLMMHGQRLSQLIRENLTLSVMMSEDAPEASLIDFGQQLKKNPYVKEVQYITREEAARELKAALGEDFIAFIGHNPLLPVFEIKLNARYANPDSIPLIEAQLLSQSQVREVVYQKSLVHLVNENIRKLSLVLLIFNVLLLLIAIVLINNTIRLSIFSRRFIIRSMQLVGATERFIQKPFLKSGLVQGIVGSVLAMAFLGLVVFLLRRELPELAQLQDSKMFVILGASLLTLGICITVTSTYISLRRYLRSDIDELH